MTAKRMKTISQRTSLRWKRQSPARDRELIASGKLPPEAMFLLRPERIRGARVVAWPDVSLTDDLPEPKRKRASKPKRARNTEASMCTVSRLKTGLGPLVGQKPTILILGSFPSEESLRAKQYYANSKNQIWRLLEAIASVKHDLPYEQRVRALKAKGIALWDVLQSCERGGSLDSKIKMETVTTNNLAALLDRNTSIKIIGLNGGTAARIFDRYFSALRTRGLEIVSLPSSSSAHAVKFEQKVQAWSVLMDSAARVAAATMP